MRTQEERFELLKKWKDETNLTFADIASTANVPVSTTQKIIEGKTKDPAFASVAPIVIALGHTLDEYMGSETIKNDTKEGTMFSLMQSSYEQLLHEKDIILDLRIAEKDAIIAEKDKAYAKLEENKNKSVAFLRQMVKIECIALACLILLIAGLAMVWLYQM